MFKIGGKYETKLNKIANIYNFSKQLVNWKSTTSQCGRFVQFRARLPNLTLILSALLVKMYTY